MNADLVVGIASGPVTAVVAAIFAYYFAVRQVRHDARASARALAANDLCTPLRELQSLIRRHGKLPTTSHKAASCFRAFYEAADRHRHDLPPTWADLRRSVRAAAGTALGGVSFVDLDPSVESIQLASPDSQWSDYADDYIEYAVGCLLRWSSPLAAKGRSHALEAFDPWLTRTGRREAAELA